jgi:hypothetical protein
MLYEISKIQKDKCMSLSFAESGFKNKRHESRKGTIWEDENSGRGEGERKGCGR